MRTAQTSQQAMFLENLWREMDKLSSSKSISKIAAQYSSEGYESGEIIELLVADGFDPQMSETYVCHMAGESDADEIYAGDQEWGFEAENQRTGDILSNFDLGINSILASNESQASEQAQGIIDSFGSDTYIITRIYGI